MTHRGYIARKHHKQLRHDNSFFKFFLILRWTVLLLNLLLKNRIKRIKLKRSVLANVSPSMFVFVSFLPIIHSIIPLCFCIWNVLFHVPVFCEAEFFLLNRFYYRIILRWCYCEENY